MFISIVNPYYAIIAVYIAGVGKEAWDYLSKKGTPEVTDALYTVIPATIVYTLNLLINQ